MGGPGGAGAQLPLACVATQESNPRHLSTQCTSHPPKCPARHTVDREHPDRLGEQLRALLPLFKLALAELKEHPHHTFGLMMDYGCLPQKPFASDEEKQRFKRGLLNINKYGGPLELWPMGTLGALGLLLTPPGTTASFKHAGGTSTPACSRSA